MYTGEPTAKGWRWTSKNVPAPHYAVIREMFYGDTQYYVPFEESPPLPGEVREGLDVEDTDIEEETLNP